MLFSTQKLVPEGCDVDKIVSELVSSGSDDEIAVLVFLSKYDAVLLTAIQLALTGGKYYASTEWTRALLRRLIERGLVRELNVTIRRKNYKIYTLTECGMKVAQALSRVIGV
jgi:DNA-binding PadR family transcriptional regulator